MIQHESAYDYTTVITAKDFGTSEKNASDSLYVKVFGRSNGQRELNSFLFQAELPPPFWLLLFWVLVDTWDWDEIMGGARNKGWLWIPQKQI